MYAADPRRARRWFWTLLAIAVLAMGALYQGMRAAPGPGPGTGLLVAFSALVLVASSAQAARILTALNGPPRFPRRWRPGRGGPLPGAKADLSQGTPRSSPAAGTPTETADAPVSAPTACRQMRRGRR